MGTFSWTFAKKTKDQKQVESLTERSGFIFYIPKEYGGGLITDESYYGYGRLGHNGLSEYDCNGNQTDYDYDIYSLFAAINDDTYEIWNELQKLKKEQKPLHDWNEKYRNQGINLYFKQYPQSFMTKFKNVIKNNLKLLPLTKENLKLSYEDIYGYSISDPNQGYHNHIDDNDEEGRPYKYTLFEKENHLFIVNHEKTIDLINKQLKYLNKNKKDLLEMKFNNIEDHVQRYIALLKYLDIFNREDFKYEKEIYSDIFRKYLIEEEYENVYSYVLKNLNLNKLNDFVTYYQNYIEKLENIKKEIELLNKNNN